MRRFDSKVWFDESPEDHHKIMLNFKIRLLLEGVGHRETKLATTIYGVTDSLTSRLNELACGMQRAEVLRAVCKTMFCRYNYGIFRLLSRPSKHEYIPSPEMDDDTDIERSTLVVALSAGYCELEKQMLESGIGLNFKPRYFETPFQVAIRLDRSSLVRQLLDTGLEARKQPNLHMVLQHAARYGRLDVVNMLMEPKYLMRLYGGDYRKALELALEMDQLEIANIIFKSHAQIQHHRMLQKRDLFWWACRRGWDELVVEMLYAGIDPNNIRFDSDGTSMSAAVVGGHCSTIAILLERGCLVRKFAKDAFSYAAKVGKIEVLEMMLGKDLGLFEPPSRSDTPSVHLAFFAAAEAGRIEVTEFLLHRGFDIDSFQGPVSRSRLLRAVIRAKQLEMLQWLVSRLGMSIAEYPDCQGTMLLDVLKIGRPEMVDFLFEHGMKKQT